MNSGSQPPAGASSVDVYRTAGGATQGKIGSIVIVGGSWTYGNGSGLGGYIFSDGGLTGDAAVPPAVAAGATATNAVALLDMITDGTIIYCAVLDKTTTDPDLPGRILTFNPLTSVWSQIGATFKTADGRGTAGTLVFHSGSLNYGTYIGVTTGQIAYMKTTAFPLPGGGIPLHANAISLPATSMIQFQGNLFAGTVSLVAGTASAVIKRVAVDTWSTSRTGPATALANAYTSLGVFNGYLFAGWTSGDGAVAARIESTPDGITWTNEITLDVAEVVCQMVTFVGNLYVVLGRCGAGTGYNTKSRILKRTTGGVWTTVDDPSDDFAGNIGVVYV